VNAHSTVTHKKEKKTTMVNGNPCPENS